MADPTFELLRSGVELGSFILRHRARMKELVEVIQELADLVDLADATVREGPPAKTAMLKTFRKAVEFLVRMEKRNWLARNLHVKRAIEEGDSLKKALNDELEALKSRLHKAREDAVKELRDTELQQDLREANMLRAKQVDVVETQTRILLCICVFGVGINPAMMIPEADA